MLKAALSLAIAALPLAAGSAIANPAPHFYPSPTVEAWQAVYSGNSGEIYVDTWSVQDGQKGEVFFWYQMHFSQPLNQVSHMQIFAGANCADGVVTDRYVNYLDASGRVISSKNDGANGQKTALAAVADIACAQSRYRD